MTHITQIIPGILLCFFLAIPAYLIGSLFPIIGGPVLGILLGMLSALIFPGILSKKRPQLSFSKGIGYTSKNLLQHSIILLGFEMNLFNVIEVGSQSLFIMLFTLSAAFITAFLVGKAMRLDSKMTTLIGVGTSICGGSAIAATAPVIRAKDADVAQGMSTIFLFNILAVFIFPALGYFLGMSDLGFGIWAGTAINDTSSVVAAATSWSSVAENNTSLALATIVKLTRTLMIVPISLVLALYTTYIKRNGKENVTNGSFHFSKVFPWFVIGFVLAAILNTFAGIPAYFSHLLVTIGKFMIIMAMVAIGLNTNLKKLLTSGWKPIFLGLCCWFSVASVSLLVQKMLGLW